MLTCCVNAKKKVYFVQTGCVFNNEYFLPYAAGIIAASAFQKPEISNAYVLADIIYKCDDFEATLQSITEPAVVAFSNYMWNFAFNLQLAARLKEKYPACITVFGGHQIDDTEQWLEKHSFIDVAIFGEGEIIFSEILLSLACGKNLNAVSGISFRTQHGITTTAKRNHCTDINKIPSPYITGIFDKIIQQNPDDSFAAVLETSRGCPYHCAYCDWGDYDIPLRHFDVARVKQEIEWCGKNNIVFITLADSNFGICETDEDIVNEFVRTKNTYGYPKAVEIAFAKYSPERVFAMNKKLYENQMSRGATLSMQTLSPVALKNIGRENITRDKFSKLIRMYSEQGIPAYTELILGLPGETYESFCEGIEYLLNCGQHNSIHVFFCEILPNAVMGQQAYLQEHGVQVLERDFSLRNGIRSDGINGRSRVIVGTKTMNRKMFLQSMLYAFTIQIFHNFGLCRVPAMYFHYEKSMEYHQFYKMWIDWMLANPDSFAGQIFNRFVRQYELCITGEATDTYENPLFGSTQFNLSDGAFLEYVKADALFYSDFSVFLSGLLPDVSLQRELVRFQRMIIRKPDNCESKETFSHNWVDYYLKLLENGTAQLQKEPVYLQIKSSSEYCAGDLQSFASAIAIKGRRIGKSIVLTDKNSYIVSRV